MAVPFKGADEIMPEIDRSSEGPKNNFKGKLLATLIASAVVMSFIATMIIASVPSEGNSPARITYEIHNPILINNSADFASQAVNESWLGDGTSETPYIIQGYEISASSMPGIQIFDSDVYFIIEGCYIHDGGADVIGHHGIYLDTCTNGALTNNICSNNNDGILLWDCTGSNTLSNNNCSGNYYGIYLESSGGSTVSNNICSSNVNDGLHLPSSSYSTATNNTCISNGGHGLSLDTSNFCTLTNNTCRSNDHSGIFLYESINNTISGNNCSSNVQNGILLDTSCSHNTLSDNHCWDNDYYGIDVKSNSNNNTVINNDCQLNYNGIVMEHSSGSALSNNTCYDNYYGIYLYIYCDHNVLYNNSCLSNTDGIYLDSSSNNTLFNNTCSNSSSSGIYVAVSSFYNTIWNNTFYHNNGAGDTYSDAHIQAADYGANNRWNSTRGYGNWWSDWTTPDVALPTGVVDNPYNVTGTALAQDRYPLTAPGVIVLIPEFSAAIVPMTGLMLIALLLGKTRRKPLT